MRLARIRTLARRARLAVAAGALLAPFAPSESATVTLEDGTVLQGEVKSLQDGVYTIESASAGTLRVRADQVRSIDEGVGRPAAPSAAPAGAALPTADALAAARAMIADNPSLLASVLALQNDPEIVAVLADPEVVKAVTAGDYAALMSNPKIVKLLENPKIRALVDAVQ